jgi:hypothetical protein
VSRFLPFAIYYSQKTIYSHLFDSSMVCSLLLTAEVAAAHATLTRSWVVPAPAAAKSGLKIS